MQPQSMQDVFNEIVGHIKKQGGNYSGWYSGIASDWEARLFTEHKVPKNHWWIARQCHSSESARKVEDALLSLGCDGGSGGGDSTTVYVYAYLKGAMTDP